MAEKTVEQRCYEALKARGVTFAAAESCTGGLIAKRITDVPGASGVFMGGVVSYTNIVKHRVLGVPADMLEEYGAVSAPVARAMAEGARKATTADCAVSVTGVAGPDRDERGNPVGTVFIGFSSPKETIAERFDFGAASREEIRGEAADEAFKLLEEKLKEMEKRRGETRRARQKNNVPVVALVGYTNVGKSSLLNALCGEQIFEADMLFATLDPTARKLVLPSGLQIILVDTVGFVSRLPHHLVEAFKSTLEEAAFADVIVKVADAGDAQAAEQLAVTDEVLGSLDCADIPQLVVYNKCDTANTVAFDPDILLTSAKTGYGLPALLAKLDEVLNHRVRTIEIVLPYDKLALADILRSRGSVAAEEYREDGVYYRGTVKIDDLHRFEEFLV